MKCCAAIIVAAGSSRRAGFDKLLAPLHGVKVLERSIRAFANCREITEIVVVCPEERFRAVDAADLETEIPVTRVDGGAERHESVQNGLAALLYTPELVAVHDGARPLITVEQISRCIQTARECGAAASAHPVTDTLKRADEERFTLPEQVDRDGLWCMETPQVFQYPLLLDAYVEVIPKSPGRKMSPGLKRCWNSNTSAKTHDRPPVYRTPRRPHSGNGLPGKSAGGEPAESRSHGPYGGH